MNTQIDKIIDDEKNPYAYAFAERSGDYSHLNLRIWLARDNGWRRPETFVFVRCQAGDTLGDASSGQITSTYGHRWGFSNMYLGIEAKEMEMASKLHRKISKFLEKEYDLNGDTKSFADYADRILRAMKIKYLISEPNIYTSGGRLSDKILTNLGIGAGLTEMARMEKGILK